MAVVKLSTAGLTDYAQYSSMLAGNAPFNPIPPSAYDLLETTTLTSGAATVSLTGLGSYSDYRHLQLRMVTRISTSGYATTYMTFNGDNASSNANYSTHFLRSQPSSNTADSYALINEDYIRVAETDRETQSVANAFGAAVVDILDFSSTNKTTTIRSFYGHTGRESTSDLVHLASGLWNNTAAVTSFEINAFTNLAVGTRLSLYGVK